MRRCGSPSAESGKHEVNRIVSVFEQPVGGVQCMFPRLVQWSLNKRLHQGVSRVKKLGQISALSGL
jgi:hypothetical protein